MSLADQLGITLRGVQTNLSKTLAQFVPGGSSQAGRGIPVLRGSGIPKLPKLSIVGAKASTLKLPPTSTSPTPGRTAAPHPTRIPTESTLGLGFRNIRSR